MDIDKLILPTVRDGIQWVIEKLSPSKKELELKISELEKHIRILTYNNETLQKSVNEILVVILGQLRAGGNYIISADSITKIEKNSGVVHIMKDSTSFKMQENYDDKDSIFDGMDEEILQCKLSRPSERGNE